MKEFSLRVGENHIDNGYGHIAGVSAGKIIALEIYSQSPGSVSITQNVGSFDKTTTLATITVGADGYGSAQSIDKFFAYGDTITVSGVPVEGNNTYSVRCFYE